MFNIAILFIKMILIYYFELVPLESRDKKKLKMQMILFSDQKYKHKYKKQKYFGKIRRIGKYRKVTSEVTEKDM